MRDSIWDLPITVKQYTIDNRMVSIPHTILHAFNDNRINNVIIIINIIIISKQSNYVHKHPSSDT